MTAVTTTRLQTEHGPLVPARGTYPIAANTILYKGAQVAINDSGYAVSPVDGDGFRIAGMAAATFDNRTGSEAGGAAGDLDVEVDHGVHFYDYSGDAPKPGQKLFSVDNATVSTSSASGTRGFAGICSEVKTLNGVAQAGVWQGPFFDAADIGVGLVNIPLASFRLSTGAAIAAFADGSADGFQLTDSEALSLRINDDSTTVFATCVPVPADLDPEKPVVFHALASRVGTANATAAITVGAFFQTVGALHSADANAGGDTSAIATNSVVNEVTRTIAAADVPAGVAALTLTMQATAALAADDMLIHAVWLEYGRV